MITEPFQILTIFLGIIAVTLMLISKFEIARKISPVILILFFSALLSNTGILSPESTFYGQLSGYAVPFAVCLILLHVHFSDIKKSGLPILKAFAIASTGSLIGCLAAGILLNTNLNEIMAGEGWKLSGPYIGTYIGGSLNFFSMWSGLEIDNPDLFAAANAVDNLTLIPIFIFWVICPKILKRWFPDTAIDKSEIVEKTDQPSTFLKLQDLTILFFIGFAIILLSGLTNTHLINPLINKLHIGRWLPKIPTILIITTIALIVAQLKYVKNLQGAKELGNFSFYLFFAAIGAMMDIPKAIGLAPVLFLYVIIIIITQVLFVLLVGRLFKMDLRMLAVASLAAKAGPSTVVAYTNAKNWNHLALPGVAVGLLGYAAGNYIALGGAYLLKMMIG